MAKKSTAPEVVKSLHPDTVNWMVGWVQRTVEDGLRSVVDELQLQMQEIATAKNKRTATYTVSEFAAMMRVKPSRVMAWIEKGQLKAFNVSDNPGRRQYRIDPEAAENFKLVRLVLAQPPRQRRRRVPKEPEGIIDFFPELR